MKSYHLYIVTVLIIAAVFADNFIPKKYSSGRFEKFGTGNYAFDSQTGLVCNINPPPTATPPGLGAGLSDQSPSSSSEPVISFAPDQSRPSASQSPDMLNHLQQMENSDHASVSKRFGFVDNSDRPYCSELK